MGREIMTQIQSILFFTQPSIPQLGVEMQQIEYFRILHYV